MAHIGQDPPEGVHSALGGLQSLRDSTGQVIATINVLVTDECSYENKGPMMLHIRRFGPSMTEDGNRIVREAVITLDGDSLAVTSLDAYYT